MNDLKETCVFDISNSNTTPDTHRIAHVREFIKAIFQAFCLDSCFIFNDMSAPSRDLHVQTVPKPGANLNCIVHSLNHRTGTPLGSTKLKLEFFLIRQRRSLIFRGINYDTRGVSFIGNLYPGHVSF